MHPTDVYKTDFICSLQLSYRLLWHDPSLTEGLRSFLSISSRDAILSGPRTHLGKQFNAQASQFPELFSSPPFSHACFTPGRWSPPQTAPPLKPEHFILGPLCLCLPMCLLESDDTIMLGPKTTVPRWPVSLPINQSVVIQPVFHRPRYSPPDKHPQVPRTPSSHHAQRANPMPRWTLPPGRASAKAAEPCSGENSLALTDWVTFTFMTLCLHLATAPRHSSLLPQHSDSECGPGASSIRTTGERVRKPHSCAPPQTC